MSTTPDDPDEVMTPPPSGQQTPGESSAADCHHLSSALSPVRRRSAHMSMFNMMRLIKNPL